MYKGKKVFDVHGHVSVPQADYAYAFRLLASNSLVRSRLLGGREGPSEEEYRATADFHVAYIDERNIDRQVLGPRPYGLLGPHMKPDQQRLWTDHVNATIAQQVSWYPGRFIGAAQLPQDSEAPDATHMVATLERAVSDHGFGAAYVSPDAGGHRSTPGLNTSYWYPLWEKAIELGVGIIIHGTNTCDDRHRAVPESYQLGFVMEQYLATQLLSHGDTFERYPDLKIVVCHCGGALNRFVKSDRHLAQKDLSDNLFFDTCAHDYDFLTAAIRQRGVPQMVFGTEAPGYPGKTADNLVPVLDSFDWLSDEDRIAIFNTNPARAFPQFASA